jgi:hypothetical protein
MADHNQNENPYHMKLSFTRILTILIAVVIFYASCKKNGTKPNSTNTSTNTTTPTKETPNYDVLSNQIAIGLIYSLTGKYGGTNINDGIKAPTTGAKLMCGFNYDTTYNYNTKAADTAKTFAGNLKFVTTCNSNVVNGYTVRDSLTNTEIGANFNNTYVVAQNYVVQTTDPNAVSVSMNGNIYISIFDKTISGTTTSGYTSIASTYVLKGLLIDYSSGIANITTGTATFNTATSNLNSTTPKGGVVGSYTGTITFTGSLQAKLTIQTSATTTKSYTINLLTGTVTAA